MTRRLNERLLAYFTTICFINKENLNMASNFIYLNKYFK
jgi:hypothetical protein